MTEPVARTIKDYRQSQPIEELQRKAAKAARPGWWTQEDIMSDKPEKRSERCPRCNSPSPELHPAVQHEGEVQMCPHVWHNTLRLG